MWLRVSGEDVADDLLDLIAAITDRALLRPADIEYDAPEKRVRISLRRLPLVRTRRVLPNVHETGRRLETVITIRQASACDVSCRMRDDAEEVQLMFGLQIEPGRISAYSAEEIHGQPLLSVAIEMSSIDVELADV